MTRIKRWRVTANIQVTDLADILNRREQKGWAVEQIIPQSAFRFTVITSRHVLVREIE